MRNGPASLCCLSKALGNAVVIPRMRDSSPSHSTTVRDVLRSEPADKSSWCSPPAGRH